MNFFEELKCWKLYDNNELFNVIDNDKEHYFFESSKKEKDITENVITNILNTCFPDIHCENTFIEFWKSISNDFFPINYIKNEKNIYEYPLYSLLVFLTNKSPSILYMDLNFNQYKYKQFEENNNCILISPEYGKIISINPQKFYKMYYDNKSNPYDINSFLFINIWNNKPSNLKSYNSLNFNKTQKEVTIKIIETKEINKNYIYIENEVFNEMFYENLLYKNNNNILTLLYNQVYSNITSNKNAFIISKKFPLENKTFFEKIKNKNGKIMDTIYKLEVEKIESKILFNINILPNVFTIDICNWYIVELKKHKSWSNLIHNDITYQIINLYQIDYLLSFTNIISKNILNKIKDLYELNNLNLHVKNYYIEKISGDKCEYNKTNKIFLKFIILLSDSIKINYNKNDIELNKGDVIIFSDNEYIIKRTNNEEIYFLMCEMEYIL